MIKLAGADEATSRWFKSLTQPGTGISCCDVSDCHPARSDWRNGQWWAEIEGKMTPIPPDKVLKQTSILENAVVCNSKPAAYYGSNAPASSTIYCFVPPLIGF